MQDARTEKNPTKGRERGNRLKRGIKYLLIHSACETCEITHNSSSSHNKPENKLKNALEVKLIKKKNKKTKGNM